MIPMRADETFGGYVRRCRRYAGLTQEQLAERVGIKRSQICHIESGTRNPSVNVARNLVGALDLDPDAMPDDGRGRSKADAEPLPSAPGGLLLLSWR